MPSLTVVDLLEDLREVGDNPGRLTFDGLHLTEEGHQGVAGATAAHLQEVLTRR